MKRKKAQSRIESLPGSLRDALEEMKESSLVREVLGEHIFKKFLDLKKREWRDFSIAVTDWEIRRYLQV